MLNRIYQMDCVDGMNLIPDDSIDLTITSPPYDNLRTYKGYSFEFESVAQQLYRVTRPGGVVVWIVGDATVKGSETGTSFRQALYFKDSGFNLHDTMIYEKRNPLPQNHNRYEQKFEYMFVLSKGIPKTFDPIREECVTKGAKYDYSKRKSSSNDEKFGSGRTRNEVKVTGSTKIKGNVWTYLVGNNKSTRDQIAFKHPAIFPEQLAQDHILSWSIEGDIVFDPFMGSGTTAKMAQINNRRYLGFEISPEYIEIINKRLKNVDEDFD